MELNGRVIRKIQLTDLGNSLYTFFPLHVCTKFIADLYRWALRLPIRAFRQIYQTKAFSVTQGSGKFARAVWFAASVKFHLKSPFLGEESL